MDKGNSQLELKDNKVEQESNINRISLFRNCMEEDTDIIKTFEAVGIPIAQTKIYLDLLKYNYSTATTIAKRTKMHRANVYDTLNKLKERNLVYSTVKDGKKVFVALACDLILEEQKEKLENIKSAVDYLQKAFKNTSTPKVYVIEGLNSLKNMLFGMLEIGEPIWLYGISEKDEVNKLLNEKSMISFHIERARKNIPLRGLFYDYPKEKMIELNKLKLTEARYLPKTHQGKIYQISQIACGERLLFTIWIKPTYTIVIENDLISQEYVEFYNFLWNYCEKVD